MHKRLYRSRDNKVIAGVLGGLAEYFNQDATLWRVGFVIFLILTGLMPGLLIYIVMWLLVPERPLGESAAEYSVRDAE